jgi:hypothetical protein
MVLIATSTESQILFAVPDQPAILNVQQQQQHDEPRRPRRARNPVTHYPGQEDPRPPLYAGEGGVAVWGVMPFQREHSPAPSSASSGGSGK